MSTTRKIQRDQWEEYFDRFTKQHLRDDRPEAATIEVIFPELGDQVEAEGARLLGITFDRRNDTLEVLLENVDHLAFHPKEIWVVEGEGGFPSSIEVVRSGGEKEILTIRPSGVPERTTPGAR